MQRKLSTFWALLLALAVLLGAAPGLAQDMAVQADVYFENGIVYTVDANNSVAEALAVKDGVIVFVGTAAEGAAYRAAADEVVDLAGGMLLPGLIDGHIHIASPDFFDFTLLGITTVDATLQAIEAYISENPEMESYLGFGYMTSMFEGDELQKGPRKERLDEILPDKPLVIASFDGHAMWLNTAAFEALGITGETVPPPGGEIIKDDATGALWGTLKDSAMSLAPLKTLDEGKLREALSNYQAHLNALGYTGIMTLAGNGFSPIPWAGLAALENDGELTLRVHGGSIVTSWRTEQDLATLAEEKEKYSGGLVRLTTAKLFADGVMDSATARLLEPYTDNPHSHGDSGWEQDALNEAVAAINALGLQAHTHAIGDGGVRMALDAVEHARANVAEGDYRNAITHLQLVATEDIARFAALDVVAVAQPYWHFKQPDYWEPIEHAVLGERADREYPMQSFLDAGVVLALASDYPVTANPNPFIAIETAVTRNMVNGEEFGLPDITDMDDPAYLLWPQERISVQDAIRGFTASGAYAMFTDDVAGTLAVGKSADMIVIDRDLLTIDPLDIGDTVVLRTYLQGNLVYRAE